MTREEQAVQCRHGIESTLRSVHEFTSGATTAAGKLLHRMNAVLSTVVGSNFGTSSYDSIGSLYDIIDREGIGMLNRCEDVSFLYFARSFAVVIEEAVRQLRQANTATVPCTSGNTVSEASWSGDTSQDEQSVRKKSERKPLTTAATISQKAAPPNRDELVRTAEWRKEMQRKFPFKILDFSYKAIEGLITIENIQGNVQEEELRELLRPYSKGDGRDFYYSVKRCGTVRRGSVRAKLMNNRAADEAVKQLNGRVLNRVAILVERGLFDARPLPKPQLHPACSKDAISIDSRAAGAAAAADPSVECGNQDAAAAPEIYCAIEKNQDSDDDEEIRDDVSCGSNFSVD